MTDYIIYAATIAGIFLIGGLGLYILTGLAGQVSIAQATYMGLGALVSSYFARSSLEDSGSLLGRSLPFPQAMLLAAIITGVVAAIFGLAFIRLRGASAISASIATSVLVLYLCERMVFLSGGSKGATSSQSLSFGSTDFSELTIGSIEFSREAGLLMLIVIMAAIVFIYTRNISISPLGRAMRTVRERNRAAQTCAISPGRTIVSAHFLCGISAGVAGALYAHVLQSFEVSSANPWLGPFGIVASMQLLAFLVVSTMRSVTISAVVIFALVFASQLFSRASANIDFFNTAQGGFISTSQVTAIVSSVLVIGVLIVSAKRAKNRA
jgi:branched-chain amino acid transport system permease protein